MQHLIFVWVIFWFIHYHEKDLVYLAHAKNWVWWLVYTSGVSPWKWEPTDVGFHLKMSDTCFQICFGYFKSLENQKNCRKIFCHECKVCQMGFFWVICYKKLNSLGRACIHLHVFHFFWYASGGWYWRTIDIYCIWQAEDHFILSLATCHIDPVIFLGHRYGEPLCGGVGDLYDIFCCNHLHWCAYYHWGFANYFADCIGGNVAILSNREVRSCRLVKV